MTGMISFSSSIEAKPHLHPLCMKSSVQMSSAPAPAPARPPPWRRGSSVAGLTPAILVTSHQSPPVRRQSALSSHLLSPTARNFSQSSYSINSNGRRYLDQVLSSLVTEDTQAFTTFLDFITNFVTPRSDCPEPQQMQEPTPGLEPTSDRLGTTDRGARPAVRGQLRNNSRGRKRRGRRRKKLTTTTMMMINLRSMSSPFSVPSPSPPSSEVQSVS